MQIENYVSGKSPHQSEKATFWLYNKDHLAKKQTKLEWAKAESELKGCTFKPDISKSKWRKSTFRKACETTQEINISNLLNEEEAEVTQVSGLFDLNKTIGLMSKFSLVQQSISDEGF